MNNLINELNLNYQKYLNKLTEIQKKMKAGNLNQETIYQREDILEQFVEWGKDFHKKIESQASLTEKNSIISELINYSEKILTEYQNFNSTVSSEDAKNKMYMENDLIEFIEGIQNENPSLAKKTNETRSKKASSTQQPKQNQPKIENDFVKQLIEKDQKIATLERTVKILEDQIQSLNKNLLDCKLEIENLKDQQQKKSNSNEQIEKLKSHNKFLRDKLNKANQRTQKYKEMTASMKDLIAAIEADSDDDDSEEPQFQQIVHPIQPETFRPPYSGPLSKRKLNKQLPAYGEISLINNELDDINEDDSSFPNNQKLEPKEKKKTTETTKSAKTTKKVDDNSKTKRKKEKTKIQQNKDENTDSASSVFNEEEDEGDKKHTEINKSTHEDDMDSSATYNEDDDEDIKEMLSLYEKQNDKHEESLSGPIKEDDENSSSSSSIDVTAPKKQPSSSMCNPTPSESSSNEPISDQHQMADNEDYEEEDKDEDNQNDNQVDDMSPVPYNIRELYEEKHGVPYDDSHEQEQRDIEDYTRSVRENMNIEGIE